MFPGFKVRDRDLSGKDVVESAIGGCRSFFSFVKESENRIVEFRAVAVEVLQLSKEGACAMSEKTNAQIIVGGGLRATWRMWSTPSSQGTTAVYRPE